MSLVPWLCAILPLKLMHILHCASMAFSIYYNDAGQLPLVYSIIVSVSCGLIFFITCRVPASERGMNHREGMAIVGLGWFAAGVFGALPFWFGDVFGASFTDCLFESLSGFSTTGSSVLTDIESVAKGLLFWRSLTHWLGGMGIIVLSLAILPFLGVGGMQLYKAEVPGPIPDKLDRASRIRQCSCGKYIYFSLCWNVAATWWHGYF